MGEYREDWFSLEIKSKRHIMDLIIEPSFAKAVCFQVHEMGNNSFQLFWNYELRPYGHLIKEYLLLNKDKLNPKMSIMEFYYSEGLAEFIRAHASGVFIADLSTDDMNLINAVVNANWRDEEYICGLDGHGYRIKIYGDTVHEFKCWCYIPEKWNELIPLVNRLIKIAKLETSRIHYEVQGITRSTAKAKNFIQSDETPVAKKIVSFEKDAIVYEDGSKLYVRKEDIF